MKIQTLSLEKTHKRGQKVWRERLQDAGQVSGQCPESGPLPAHLDTAGKPREMDNDSKAWFTDMGSGMVTYGPSSSCK